MIKQCAEIENGKAIRSLFYSDLDAKEEFFETKEQAESNEQNIIYWNGKSPDDRSKLRRLFNADESNWDNFESVAHFARINSL